MSLAAAAFTRAPVRARRPAAPGRVAPTSRPHPSPASRHDGPPRLRPSQQPILIGPVDDALERAADAVTAGRETPVTGSAVGAALPLTTPHAPASVHATLAGPGRPLPPATRAHFEARLRTDLSGVRLHDDSAARASARDVYAAAYTVGHHVVMGDPPDAQRETVLGHELAHTVQDAPTGRTLRRYDCQRLLGTTRFGQGSATPIPEHAVQQFMFEELEEFGDVEREFWLPGGSFAPWRTDDPDDTTIRPQVTGGGGFIDIAMHAATSRLELLEVKEASWWGRQNAETQLTNYVVKGYEDVPGLLRRWQKKGHPYAYFSELRPMPTKYYRAPDEPVDIVGRQVALAWCGDGILVFKPIDDKDTYYCGISDKGKTDALIQSAMNKAIRLTALALARRLKLYFPSDNPNVQLLIAKVEMKLRSVIETELQNTLEALCAVALEVSLVALLEAFRRRLANTELIDLLMGQFTAHDNRPTSSVTPSVIAESTARSAFVIALGLVLDAAMTVAPAL
jgi:hypothetical protein